MTNQRVNDMAAMACGIAPAKTEVATKVFNTDDIAHDETLGYADCPVCDEHRAVWYNHNAEDCECPCGALLTADCDEGGLVLMERAK